MGGFVGVDWVWGLGLWFGMLMRLGLFCLRVLRVLMSVDRLKGFQGVDGQGFGGVESVGGYTVVRGWLLC